jgi:transcriptional regulator with XRE-family HTH domain
MSTNEQLYQQALDSADPDSLEFADLRLAITDRVYGIMERERMTQKDLAQRLGKQESEVSRWLNGLHNLTLRNLARLNVALGHKVVVVPPAEMHRTYFVLDAGTNDLYRKGPRTSKPVRMEVLADDAKAA